jgi:hygromycin-B 7''-O-kinase
MSLLPTVTTDDDITRLRTDTARCLAAIRAAAEQEGLSSDQATFFPDGSSLVGAIGQTVIKIFAPIDRELMRTKTRVLDHLSGRLECPTPQFLGEGELEGWPYVVMGRLEGVPLSQVWQEIRPENQGDLCQAIGQTIAELHNLSITPIQDLPPDWDRFMAQQRQASAQRQRSFGLDERWVSQIDAYLASVALPHQPPVLLHTELMRQHFFVRQTGGSVWTLSGLLDFEPAMVGNPEYDFASVGLFITKGHPGLLERLLGGYQQIRPSPEMATGAFQRRALAYTLLHRYSRMPWYLGFMPIDGAVTLDDLAARWWAHG